jgi:hypothetical protein
MAAVAAGPSAGTAGTAGGGCGVGVAVCCGVTDFRAAPASSVASAPCPKIESIDTPPPAAGGGGAAAADGGRARAAATAAAAAEGTGVGCWDTTGGVGVLVYGTPANDALGAATPPPAAVTAGWGRIFTASAATRSLMAINWS